MFRRNNKPPQETSQPERQYTAPSGYGENLTSIGTPMKVRDINAERGFNGQTPIHDRNFTPQERAVRDRRLGRSSTPLWLQSINKATPQNIPKNWPER